jgi:glycine oxidase
VRTAAGFEAADLTLVAAGCWSGLLADAAQELLPPTPPVRGQMLALAPASLPGGAVLMASCGYLVPRRSGRLLVGSTMEHAGYDCHPTGAGTATLLAAAQRLVPALAQARLLATWAGLRPGSPDGLPSIGHGPVPGLMVATGHLRNGVLLAPITARLIADLAQGRAPGLDLAPFDPCRHRAVARPPG